MAGYYKKRRTNPGPSKNEEKAARTLEQKRQEHSGAALSQLYPSVKQLSIQLDISSPQKLLLSQETRVFGPADHVQFSVSCPGRCGVGSFDVAAKIEQVVAAKEAKSVSHGTCQIPLYAGTSEACGCQLECRIEAAYVPDPQPAPSPVPGT